MRKTESRRTAFDANADHTQVPDTGPQRLRYPCRSEGCPMPGTVDGECGYHYRENPSQWGQITRVLVDWECVTQAVRTARRVMTAPDTCVDPKAQELALIDAWKRLLPAVVHSGWRQRLEPQPRENLGDWGRRIEVFLGARIKECLLGGNAVVDETRPTPFVAEARKELRGQPLNNLEITA
jgi:hypothetical protein